MNKQLKGVLQLIVSIGFGIFLVWLAVRKLGDKDIAEIKEAFERADYRWLLLGPFIGFVSNFSRAQRWRMLLKPVGYVPGFVNTFCSVMVMYFANLAFPRLGEVARCGILNKYEKVPLDKAIGTMVTERIVDMLSILLVGAYLFVAEHDRLIEFFVKLAGGKSTGSGNSYLPLILLMAMVAMFFMVFRFRNRVSFFRKVVDLLKGIWEGVQSIRYVENPLMFLFHSIMIWVAYYLMIYLSFYALGETANVGWNAAWACLFFGGFAMAATQGGIGAYPLAVQQVLILYGVTSNIGLAFGWIVWTVQTVSLVFAGILAMGLLAWLNKGEEQETKLA